MSTTNTITMKNTTNTCDAHANIQKAIRALLKKSAFTLKEYDNIHNCVTIKYNNHVITDVYFIRGTIRYSTKSIFFVDDISSEAKRNTLIKSVTTKTRSCNLIKNVTNFQIKASDVETLDFIIKKGITFYDNKASQNVAKSEKGNVKKGNKASAKKSASTSKAKSEKGNDSPLKTQDASTLVNAQKGE